MIVATAVVIALVANTGQAVADCDVVMQKGKRRFFGTFGRSTRLGMQVTQGGYSGTDAEW